jgi:hypothetical protein
VADAVHVSVFRWRAQCKPPTTFTTTEHYYTEDDIMQVGQSCINDQKMWTDWDHSRQRDHPNTVTDALGLRCQDRDDEDTCPRARRCIHNDHCFTDQPDWSNDLILQRPNPLGWGPETPGYLDPTIDHHWVLPPEYSWHLETATWSVTPRDPEDYETLG